jgi:radical SAM superfamily enzyme YgiQ (UPF0313 family)
MYSDRVSLPFTIETTANSISPEKLQLLADMGCQSISIGVETSNENLRKSVLKKNISNSCFSETFKLITKYGLRKVANFMFFLPHQTAEDMYQDIICCQDWKIEAASPRIFYPYLGTALRNYCLDRNLLDCTLLERIEDEYAINSLADLSNKWISFQDTVLKFDDKTKQTGKILLENFILLQEIPQWMHKWANKLLEQRNNIPDMVFNELNATVYKKRFEMNVS